MNKKTIVKIIITTWLISGLAMFAGKSDAQRSSASTTASTDDTLTPSNTAALTITAATSTTVSPAPTTSTATGTAASPSPTPEPSLYKQHKNSPATTIIDITGRKKRELKTMFYIRKIDDDTFESMQGKSYPKNCPIKRDDLRRVRILYYGYDHETHIGELIVNKKRAVDFRDIFRILYCKKYEIEKVQPIDAYDGNDTRSMKANNTSCFNYRVVEGTTSISKHAYGVAIDINPRINPYVYWENGKKKVSPKNGRMYADRSKTYDHPIITHDDICYKLFHKRGYFWGGDWITIKDYQHFQKPL